ncbi:MAG: aldo/keto reductase [Caldilineaceae bacterium]
MAGTNQFGGESRSSWRQQYALMLPSDLGINFIDTADIYTQGRSEETLGVALKGKWDKVVLGTKVSMKTGDGSNGGEQPATTL